MFLPGSILPEAYECKKRAIRHEGKIIKSIQLYETIEEQKASGSFYRFRSDAPLDCQLLDTGMGYWP